MTCRKRRHRSAAAEAWRLVQDNFTCLAFVVSRGATWHPPDKSKPSSSIPLLVVQPASMREDGRGRLKAPCSGWRKVLETPNSDLSFQWHIATEKARRRNSCQVHVLVSKRPVLQRKSATKKGNLRRGKVNHSNAPNGQNSASPSPNKTSLVSTESLFVRLIETRACEGIR